MKKYLVVAILFLLSISCASDEDAQSTRGKVVGISDGDTFVLLINGVKRESIHLATIDAPENKQAFGGVAKQSLSELIYNKTVTVFPNDRDNFGRIIAEVFVGDTNVNVEQLRRGLAWHYKAFERQQSKKQREEYRSAENEARTKKLGLWNEPAPIPPWDFRKKKKRDKPTASTGKTYKGKQCTDDCSGHMAGYEWAEKKGITDSADCRGNSASFIEGCESYVMESKRFF